METSRYVEESGPDDDHQTINSKLRASKVVEAEPVECTEITWNSGVFEVERSNPGIDRFLRDVPRLREKGKTYGLIWDKSLSPENCKYEKGDHYLSTREAERKTTHCTVSFYRDGVTGVKFAVKTLEKDARFHADEIKIGLRCQHPNICSVYGIIVQDGCVQILQEHAGSALNEERTWIAESPKRIQSFVTQSFKALHTLHSHGYVHCDIKPDNLMIAKSGGDFTVKIIDFGTCQCKGTVLPHDAQTTLLYWSPEIWQALIQQKSVVCAPAMDIYALALTVYFVQTSNHLLQRLESQDLKNVMTKDPDSLLYIALPEGIPSDVRLIMKQCLDGKPDNRLSAEQAVQQLTESVLAQPAVQEMNYRESFKRMCTSLQTNPSTSNPDTSWQVKQSTVAFPSVITSQVQYFVGSGKGIEKRELKSRRNSYSTPKSAIRHQAKQKAVTKPSAKMSENFVSPSEPALDKGNCDDKSYPCSTMLKNLALQIRPQAKNPSNEMGPQQFAEHLKKNKPPSERQAMDGTFKFSGDRPNTGMFGRSPFKISRMEKPVEADKRLLQQSPGESTDLHINQADQRQSAAGFCNPEKSSVPPTESHKNNSESNTSICLTNMSTSTQIDAAPGCSAKDTSAGVDCGLPKDVSVDCLDGAEKDSGGTEDDMEFVYDVFGHDLVSQGDMAILDSMFGLLDKEESTSRGIENHVKVINVNSDAVSSTASTRHDTESKSMDVSQEGNTMISTPTSSKFSDTYIKGSRKRMAEPSDPMEVPGKAACPQPMQDDTGHEQLPNFDQILPEKNI